jgi:hypothetical protein
MLQAGPREAKRPVAVEAHAAGVYNAGAWRLCRGVDETHVALRRSAQGKIPQDRERMSNPLSMRLLFACAGLAFASVSLAQHGEPLHVRNLNPLVAVFGLPAWDTVAPGNRIGVSLEVANHYRLSARGDDVLILDGETVRTNVSFSHGFAQGWSIGAELPYYRIGGGVLDDLIDGWHSAFALPDGGRNNRPEGELLFRIGDGRSDFFELNSPASALGDAQLKVAKTVGRDGEFIMQGAVKLPTGDASRLTGSGSTDLSLTLLRAASLPARRRPAGYYWGVGVVRAGNPDRIDFAAKTWVYTAVVGGSWQPWRRFGLKAQLDVHSPFYDSQLEEIGESAIQATFGAWMRSGRRGIVEFAMVEDLEVSTAPDVVVQIGAHWQW